MAPCRFPRGVFLSQTIFSSSYRMGVANCLSITLVSSIAESVVLDCQSLRGRQSLTVYFAFTSVVFEPHQTILSQTLDADERSSRFMIRVIQGRYIQATVAPRPVSSYSRIKFLLPNQKHQKHFLEPNAPRYISRLNVIYLSEVCTSTYHSR